jgi:ketosteroid isomerase-like protein
MKTTLSLFALAALLSLNASNASTPTAPRPAAAGPATMAALTQQFTAALEQQDLAKATAFLAKNVRFHVNTEAVVSGRDSVSTAWLKQTFSVSSNLKLTHLQSGSDATMGYDTGYYSYDIKPMANLPKGAVGHGSYMTLTRKEGATWQITYVHIAADPIKVNK